MTGFQKWMTALAAVALVAAGYSLGRSQETASAPTQASAPAVAPTSEPKRLIYYQDPDGKPDYSPTPKKTADGRDYKPVYGEGDNAAAPSPAVASKPQGKGKILYYRNPMGLPDTSPVPKKDSMSMDYIPVYENEAGADANVVQVSPERVQMLGVRTETVQMRAAQARPVRATGTVEFDERGLATVTTKVAGWVEKLNVGATGESVRAGQPLLEIYSPDLVAAEQEYLVVTQMDHTSMVHGDSALMIDAAKQRLRALDVPDGEIKRLQHSGKAARRIAVLAPVGGVVTEKDAVLGMHVDPGTPLYKTADLSQVWLVAQVQEQDLAQIKTGQSAHATFVAFPGRVFDGVVDFISPTLKADTRTAKVRVVIPNNDNLLRSDMYAMVEIESAPASPASVLTVPNSAIIDSGARQVVLVVKGEGRFEPRLVHLGVRGDDYTEVVSGLSAGEQVVTSANFLIDAESNLRAALQSFTPPEPAAGSPK